MNNDINYVLNYMTKYVKDKYMHDSEPMLNYRDIETVLKYIYEKDKEIKRLNNIINTFEEYLRDLYHSFDYETDESKILDKVIDKLKGLKEK